MVQVPTRQQQRFGIWVPVDGKLSRGWIEEDTIYSDSELVIYQVSAEYKATEPLMLQYRLKAMVFVD